MRHSLRSGLVATSGDFSFHVEPEMRGWIVPPVVV
jgi:hypothetical protein